MDKKIEHIGTFSGKVLLFGGVYSNLQALESLKAISQSEQILPEKCISTGDIIGYCAQPEETTQFFKDWGAKSIAGNVEIQLREGAEDCACDFKKGSRCDGFSKMWYPFAQSKLSRKSMDYLATLPDHIQFEYGGKQVMIVHGSYFNTSEFIFKSSPWETKQPNFSVSNADVIIGGHCGLPFYDTYGELLWLNPGVIGMPANDGTSKGWYVLLNDDNQTFEFQHHRLDYNHQLTNKLMHLERLPKEYAETILTGIWDNTEILPKAEIELQGCEIQF